MNYTALLETFRRERNGAVADAMRYYGAKYGVNYGVSLPTVRQIARREQKDHDFARFLYMQQVRELRLAALHIAQIERITVDELPFWAEGIINSEVAEEAAFALFRHLDILPELFQTWLNEPNPLLQYTALLAASRHCEVAEPAEAWIIPAVEVVRRHAAELSVARSLSGVVAEPVEATEATKSFAARLTARGAVALLVAVGSQNDSNRQMVLSAISELKNLPAEKYLREEAEWQLKIEN